MPRYRLLHAFSARKVRLSNVASTTARRNPAQLNLTRDGVNHALHPLETAREKIQAMGHHPGTAL
jgi:hypothetical protein